jgi:hypothetical protein
LKRIVVSNEQRESGQVVVELWGDAIISAAGRSAVIECANDAAAWVNVVVKAGQIELWAEGDRAFDLGIDRTHDVP